MLIVQVVQDDLGWLRMNQECVAQDGSGCFIMVQEGLVWFMMGRGWFLAEGHQDGSLFKCFRMI